MAGGLLSLKWNNHRSTFFHVLSTVRSKESYCDVTLACDGKFYPVHKLVLSTCSDYFERMFERTNCKHPIIVLKDIRHEELEALLNYMYVGEVNVLQNELAGLIKAAECLMIKGLAVPDEAPSPTKDSKRTYHSSSDSPHAKRRKRDDDGRLSSQNQHLHRDGRETSHSQRHSSSASMSTPSRVAPPSISPSPSVGSASDAISEECSQSEANETQESSKHTVGEPSSSQNRTSIPEVIVDEPTVKEEPQEIEEEVTETKDNIVSQFPFEPVQESDSRSDPGGGYDSQMLSSQSQSVEDIVNEALPGSSGLQGNSLWEGDGSLQGFPMEGFSGEGTRPTQMGTEIITHETEGKLENQVRGAVTTDTSDSGLSQTNDEQEPVKQVYGQAITGGNKETDEATINVEKNVCSEISRAQEPLSPVIVEQAESDVQCSAKDGPLQVFEYTKHKTIEGKVSQVGKGRIHVSKFKYGKTYGRKVNRVKGAGIQLSKTFSKMLGKQNSWECALNVKLCSVESPSMKIKSCTVARECNNQGKPLTEPETHTVISKDSDDTECHKTTKGRAVSTVCTNISLPSEPEHEDSNSEILVKKLGVDKDSVDEPDFEFGEKHTKEKSKDTSFDKQDCCKFDTKTHHEYSSQITAPCKEDKNNLHDDSTIKIKSKDAFDTKTHHEYSSQITAPCKEDKNKLDDSTIKVKSKDVFDIKNEIKCKSKGYDGDYSCQGKFEVNKNVKLQRSELSNECRSHEMSKDPIDIKEEIKEEFEYSIPVASQEIKEEFEYSSPVASPLKQADTKEEPLDDQNSKTGCEYITKLKTEEAPVVKEEDFEYGSWEYDEASSQVEVFNPRELLLSSDVSSKAAEVAVERPVAEKLGSRLQSCSSPVKLKTLALKKEESLQCEKFNTVDSPNTQGSQAEILWKETGNVLQLVSHDMEVNKLHKEREIQVSNISKDVELHCEEISSTQEPHFLNKHIEAENKVPEFRLFFNELEDDLPAVQVSMIDRKQKPLNCCFSCGVNETVHNSKLCFTCKEQNETLLNVHQALLESKPSIETCISDSTQGKKSESASLNDLMSDISIGKLCEKTSGSLEVVSHDTTEANNFERGCFKGKESQVQVISLVEKVRLRHTSNPSYEHVGHQEVDNEVPGLQLFYNESEESTPTAERSLVLDKRQVDSKEKTPRKSESCDLSDPKTRVLKSPRGKLTMMSRGYKQNSVNFEGPKMHAISSDLRELVRLASEDLSKDPSESGKLTPTSESNIVLDKRQVDSKVKTPRKSESFDLCKQKNGVLKSPRVKLTKISRGYKQNSVSIENPKMLSSDLKELVRLASEDMDKDIFS